MEQNSRNISRLLSFGPTRARPLFQQSSVPTLIRRERRTRSERAMRLPSTPRGPAFLGYSRRYNLRIRMDSDFDLRSVLPSLLPVAIAWAEARSVEGGGAGSALDSEGIVIALAVGVQHPELVRICVVESLPLPEDASLRMAALQTGLLGPGIVGITLGYSILICRGHESIRLLSHELRHVHQYESHGSIAGFLPAYLQQIATCGYRDAPFEIDAREHEQSQP